MTDTAVDSTEIPKQIPSTAGMTTKVVKGSIWTLGGSVLPLAVSFISTPFIIRFLGSESYGVLLLVGLIPTYFSFADFGMGVASTKFASEAFGQGDQNRESEMVWTATAIAAVSSLVVAVPMFLLSYAIVRSLNVPEDLQGQASVALKIASVAFVFGILASVLNSPMLARLRMDLNTVTAGVPKILLAAVTPFILYFGGGIVEAVSWAFIVGVGTSVAVFYFSGRLLPELFKPVFNRKLIRPLLTFGGGWIVAMIAAILLVNFEKLALTKMVSVKSLAYYSVAFTFASMATMFSMAMLQSLVPAFSQLLAPEKKAEFDMLFVRGMRLNLILLLPAIVLLFVIAKPFFTLWAGEEFGRESTLPFYLLLFGLLFNILAYIPHSTITAKGRTDIFAKLYWVELAIYVVVVIVLINYFGIIGAAAAWSFRVIFDAFMITWASSHVAGVSLRLFLRMRSLVVATLALVPAVLLAFYDNFSVWLILITPACVAIYFTVVVSRLIDADEKTWMLSRTQDLRRLIGSWHIRIF